MTTTIDILQYYRYFSSTTEGAVPPAREVRVEDVPSPALHNPRCGIAREFLHWAMIEYDVMSTPAELLALPPNENVEETDLTLGALVMPYRMIIGLAAMKAYTTQKRGRDEETSAVPVSRRTAAGRRRLWVDSDDEEEEESVCSETNPQDGC